MTLKNAKWYILLVALIWVCALLLAGVAGWPIGEVLSLGQLIVEVTLIPAAIIGFIMAAEEFGKAQARPELDLRWDTGFEETGNELVLDISPSGVETLRIRPVLVNEGNAIGVWYLVNFTIPGDLTPEWSPIIGDTHHWRAAHHKHGLLLTFMSNGQIAVYPRYPLILARLEIRLNADQAKRDYQVPYTIVTDSGQRRDDFLTLRFAKKPVPPPSA